jgi:hypothetical protein
LNGDVPKKESLDISTRNQLAKPPQVPSLSKEIVNLECISLLNYFNLFMSIFKISYSGPNICFESIHAVQKLGVDLSLD